MAREQPIVARDFMGLGMMGISTETDEAAAEGRISSLPDLDSSVFTVSKLDCGSPRKADMAFSGGPSAASMINNGAFLNGMAFAGIRHSNWNKAAALQHLLPLRGVQDEKYAQAQISAENAPERSYPHIPHPAQAWWRRDPSIKCSPGRCDDHGLGDFQGAPSKNLLPLPVPNVTMQHAGFSDARHKRMSMSETQDKQESAPLTIFYRGNVNVFNDITAEKAQAIMVLAGGGTMQRSMIDFLGSTRVHDDNIASNLTGKIQGESQACCNIESGHGATDQACHGNASMQLNLEHPSIPAPASPDQPSVPKALPQARKASLTRFLEKRRERVQSKAPYFLKQIDSSSSPEERFSSSNDMASYNKPSSNMDEKKRVTMAGWMERLTEYATCDLGTDMASM